MEASGVVTCFNRSVKRYGLRYTEYLGDGDSKGYKAVCEADPYNVPIKKSECIGHIQKRVGRKLRNLRDDGVCNNLYDDVVDETSASNDSKKKMKTKKPAKLRLTDKMINKLQNYYGIAVRACTGKTVPEMKREIGAALFHCCRYNTEEQRHMFCPQTSMSWCKYQLDKVNGTDLFKEKTGIHNKIFKLIKPVSMDLSNDELLKKCIHGKTQNTNESLNAVILKKCPKYIYVFRTTLEIDVDSTIINFNSGATRVIDVMKDYGLAEAYYTKKFCRKKDSDRIKESIRKETVKSKTSRKRLRAIRKGYGDKTKAKEGLLYASGMGDE